MEKQEEKMMKILLLLIGVWLTLAAGDTSGDYIATTVEKSGNISPSYMETTFGSDGKLYIFSMPVGSWKEDKVNNSIIIHSLMGDGKPEIYKIIKNKDGELILKRGKSITKYMKIDKKKMVQNNQKALFLGSWQIKKDPSVKESFRFDLPSNFSYIKDDKKENSTKKINGSWYYFPDKNTIIITSFANTVQGKNSIIELSEKRLVLKNGKQEIEARKIEDSN
jgi:hypothetical protein